MRDTIFLWELSGWNDLFNDKTEEAKRHALWWTCKSRRLSLVLKQKLHRQNFTYHRCSNLKKETLWSKFMEMLKATLSEEKSRAEGHCTGKYYMLGLLQNQILIISAIIPSVGCSWWFEYQKNSFGVRKWIEEPFSLCFKTRLRQTSHFLIVLSFLLIQHGYFPVLSKHKPREKKGELLIHCT